MNVSLDLNKAFEQTMKFYKEQKVKIVQENNQFPYLKIDNDPNGENIKYCVICFGYEGKLVPMFCNSCIICSKR